VVLETAPALTGRPFFDNLAADMHDQQTAKALQDFGLSEKEAVVYLASLAVGPASVMEIAAGAKLTRPTTHLVVKALVKVGYLTVQRRGKRHLFKAVDPSHFSTLVAEERHALKRREQAAELVIEEIGAVAGEDESLEVKLLPAEEARQMFTAACRRSERPTYRLMNAVGLAKIDVGEVSKAVVQVEFGRRLPADARVRTALPHRPIGAGIDMADDELYFWYRQDGTKCLYLKNAAIATTVRTMFEAMFDESRLTG
jgi:DNA-binding MarR family transcriptional regulator